MDLIRAHLPRTLVAAGAAVVLFAVLLALLSLDNPLAAGATIVAGISLGGVVAAQGLRLEAGLSVARDVRAVRGDTRAQTQATLQLIEALRAGVDAS